MLAHSRPGLQSTFKRTLCSPALQKQRRHIGMSQAQPEGAAATATGRTSPTAASAQAGALTVDPIVQYLVIRKDLWTELKWPLGSLVAQACHAATAVMWQSQADEVTKQYLSPENIDSMHKVVLEVKGEAQLRQLSEKLAEAGIVHKLWVEQPEDFVTCLAVKPYRKSAVALYMKKYQLCKAPLA